MRIARQLFPSMPRRPFLLRFLLVSCAAGSTMGAGVWFVVFGGRPADLSRDAGDLLLPLVATGILTSLLFLLLLYLLVRRYFRNPLLGLVAEASLTDLVKFTSSHRNLVMKVDSGGKILYANPGVDQTLYEMGLPPQHAELLLPMDTATIARSLLSAGEKRRVLTCEAEGRIIEYTLYGLEDENAVVFHGVDRTEREATKEERPPSRRPEILEDTDGQAFPLRAGTVLLVDDEDLVREVAGAMLTSLGCEILAASNGKEAVEIFRRENARISFILLDLQMPVMDGRKAFEEMRRIDPSAKIVLSTGSRGKGDLERFQELGAAAVLSKPYGYAELLRVAGLFLSPAPLPFPVEEH